MFDEPSDTNPTEKLLDPVQRAIEQTNQFRIHAEIAAVFEATRKFDAEIIAGLDPNLARDIQRAMGKLDKSRSPESPILPPTAIEQASEVLNMPESRELPTNHYHVHRRPGEVMLVRWLGGDEVDLFYQRLQAHFDAALNHFREEERAATEWKNDPQTTLYLDALDKIEVKLADRYLRDLIRETGICVLSTQTADELDINYLSEHVMSVAAAEIVGENNAPPDNPSEKDRAWFYKLFLLRGLREGVEQMCFFTYLQKSDENDW